MRDPAASTCYSSVVVRRPLRDAVTIPTSGTRRATSVTTGMVTTVQVLRSSGATATGGKTRSSGIVLSHALTGVVVVRPAAVTMLTSMARRATNATIGMVTLVHELWSNLATATRGRSR